MTHTFSDLLSQKKILHVPFKILTDTQVLNIVFSRLNQKNCLRFFLVNLGKIAWLSTH